MFQCIRQIKHAFFDSLKRIDLFGVSINIRFKDQEKYRTKFGGVFSILLIALMLILTINILNQLVNKTKPSVLMEDIITQQPSKFTLTQDNFSFAVGLYEQNLKPFIDSTYFTIEGTFLYKINTIDEFGNKKTEYINKVILLNPCKLEDFKVETTEEYFQSLDYKNHFCLDYSQELYLEGQFDSENFSVIEIRLKQCTGNNCKSKSEIQNRLRNTFMQIYYTTSIVQPTDYENSFKFLGQTQFYYTNLGQSQAINMQYMNTYVVDSIGLFESEKVQNRALVFNQDRLLYSTKEELYLISIFLEKNKEKYYYRSYITLKDAFTQLGGIFNFLFLMGSILCQPYSKMQLKRKLLNSTFSFPTKPTKDNNPDKTTQKSQNINNSQIQSPLKKLRKCNRDATLNQSVLEEAAKEESIKRIFQNSLEVAKVRTKEFFLLLLQKFSFQKSDQYEMVQLGLEKVYQYTDISFIINKLIEIEKIKHLILEDDQINLFEFIPKPKIKTIYSETKKQQSPSQSMHESRLQNMDYLQKQSQQEINILSVENKDMKFKAKKAQDAFNQIYKNKTKQSKIDKKLITMLDKDLICFLQMQTSMMNLCLASNFSPLKEKLLYKNEDISCFSLSKQSMDMKLTTNFTQQQDTILNYKEKMSNSLNLFESQIINEHPNPISNQCTSMINETKQIPQKKI